MEDYSIPKKNLGVSVRGRRPVGRLHNRWEDNIQKDAAYMPHT